MTPIWPKEIPTLSQEQEQAREQWMKLWHDLLPQKYQMVESFNHGYLAGLPIKDGCKTLEIGAGLGEHAQWENLNSQEYVFLEYRKEWCDIVSQKYPNHKVIFGDIQKQLTLENNSFDRIIAIHVLEHLPDLPKALIEVKRLLKPNGYFDIVIPCEGGIAYEYARKLSSERIFKKHFQMDYKPIIKAEHLNTYKEIFFELNKFGFRPQKEKYFPFFIKVATLNLCYGARFYLGSN